MKENNEHASYGFENLLYKKKVSSSEKTKKGNIITIGVPYENFEKNEVKQEGDEEEGKESRYEINEDLLAYFERRDLQCLDEDDAEECKNQVSS